MVRLHQPGAAVTRRRPAPRATGPSGFAAAVVPGNESTLIEGGSTAVGSAGGESPGGGPAPTDHGSLGFASAPAFAWLSEPADTRDFQPRPMPIASATTTSDRAP